MPSANGQIVAMEQAYAVAKIAPELISWIECHATGTVIGDTTEIESMQRIFGQRKEKIAIGALKANIGHSITASAAGALISVLSGFAARLKPPVRAAGLQPLAALQDSGFKILSQPEPWEVAKNQGRFAAINAFGFGGNNAHLIVQEWDPAKFSTKSKPVVAKPAGEIAIVGIGIVAASAIDKNQFSQALFHAEAKLAEYQPQQWGGYLAALELPIKETRFAPADLERSLGQQLAVLKAAQEALAQFTGAGLGKTSVMIGMQCDAEIARFGLRWRLAELFPGADRAWLEQAQQAVIHALTAADVLGTMPNISANRLNQLFDFKAPSFTVSAEELSGIVALQKGVRALQMREIDTAIIGAVDMCCETVQQSAKQKLQNTPYVPGDAAVVLVLKRMDDAQAYPTIYGVFPDASQTVDESAIGLCWHTSADDSPVNALFGNAHAASGLLHVAAAALACQEKLLPNGKTNMLVPWAAGEKTRMAKVITQALGGQQATLYVKEGHSKNDRFTHSKPFIQMYAGKDPQAVLMALKTGIPSERGPAKLTIVAHDEAELRQRQQQAVQFLTDRIAGADVRAVEGVYFYEKPLAGKLAFVFTGATTSYKGMGLDLLLRFPDLLHDLATNVPSVQTIINQLYQCEAINNLNMFEELKVYSLLTQVHARLTQKIFQLRPDACIGYCSGETNALFATNAWRDMEQLFTDIDASHIYTKSMLGEFSILNDTWKNPATGHAEWEGWRIFAPVEQVETAVAIEPFARFTIVNSASDCIIAGSPAGCKNVLEKLGKPNAARLPYTMVIHCPEFKPVADLWYRLHHRATSPVPDVRFYSSGTGQSYTVNADNAAMALLSQAADVVDFPRVINNAWQDGVRIFLEHGPRGLCSRFIKEILQDKEHLTVSLDAVKVNPVTQAAYAAAQLLAAGLVVDYKVFSNSRTE